MNLPFQRPTADSLALSSICLLTVRALNISDKKKQQKQEEKQTRSNENNEKMI